VPSPRRPRVRPVRRAAARLPRLVLAAAVLLSAATAMSALSALSYTPSASASTRTGGDTRPNVLLITTDDQTLTDLRHMPRTRRLIADQGVSFEGVSPHPLCCPARAEILTGQFAQNNGVRSNAGRYGGYKRLRTGNTIATWLQDAGYHTVFMGKFLNGYTRRSDSGAAPGWDDWNPTVRGVYQYHHYMVRHDDRVRTYQRYQTDMFTNLAVQKIRQASRRKRPFFLWQSYVAPHVRCPPSEETEMCWRTPMPADRHRGLFRGALPPAMDSPAFNEADLTDKPFPLSKTPLLSREQLAHVRELHRRRLQSLQAVDEGIATMFEALEATGELDNTLVIFTSDNGYLLGQHRYVGKVMPYEPALRVPLLMRGPGLPRGVERNRVATPVDLAPTISAVAQARPGLPMDGRNLLPVARGTAPGWETLLVQAGPYRKRDEAQGWLYRGVRTDRYTFAYYLFSDEYELYDRRRDPEELDNLAGDPRYAPVLRALRWRAAVLASCVGRECRRSFRALPAPRRDGSSGQPTTDPSSAPTTEPTTPTTEPTTAPSTDPSTAPTPGTGTGTVAEPTTGATTQPSTADATAGA